MYTLRPYQQEAVDVVINDINSTSPSKGVLVLPTGSGKSLIISGIAQTYDGPILVLQPSLELLSQNLKKFTECGGVASVYSASMNSKEVGHVTYGTLGSVIKAIDSFKALKNLLLIIDEAHYKAPPEKGTQFRTFVDAVKPKYSYGLTATPFRLYNSLAGSFLKMITRTRPKYFSKILYVQQISEIIDLEYWAPSIDERWRYDSSSLELNTTGTDFTETSIKEANESNSVNKSIAIKIHKLLQEDKRKSILVFTDSVESAEIFTEYFQKYTTAEMVAGKTAKKKRNNIVEGFKSGEIRVVFNYGTLTTGFDHPTLDAIIMGRPTNSLGAFYQIYGRGVRVAEGKENFLFLDVCDNLGRLCHPRNIVIEDCPTSGWAVFAGENVITGVPLGMTVTKQDVQNALTSQIADPGAMPFGRWKGRSVTEMCKRDRGYAEYMARTMDTSKYGPKLKNVIEGVLKHQALKNLIK